MLDDKIKLKCLGIIMDGNRRWAKKRGLPSFKGHDAGYKKLQEVVSWSKESGIKTLIVYAFSTENWQRSEKEVNHLIKLFSFFLNDEKIKNDFKKEKVRVKFIGQTEKFSKDIQKRMEQLEEETEKYSEFNLLIAMSYGGRAEILSAVNRAIKGGKDFLEEKDISDNLWTSGFLNPDLIIRTSGEERLSGFLPWQGVYSELTFTKTYWPDLSRKEFGQIISNFHNRERRKGK